MPVATAFVSPPLGFSIPYQTPHAVSVSLPTWRDNVDYEEGEKRVVEAMQTGYPRFFVHRSIQRLASIADDTLATHAGDRCYLYPSRRIAEVGAAFLATRDPPVEAYIKQWIVAPPGQDVEASASSTTATTTIYALFTDEDGFKVQKQYWQHAGDGISSRLAEHCLHLLGASSTKNGQHTSPSASTSRLPGALKGFSRNRHYSKKSSAALEAILGSATDEQQHQQQHNGDGDTSNGLATASATAAGEETSTYIEERYARNLSASQAPLAKLAMRRRVAGVLREGHCDAAAPNTVNGHHHLEPSVAASQAASTDLQGTAATLAVSDIANGARRPRSESASDDLQPSSRGVAGLTEDDVYLYPGGMSAIFHSFLTVLEAAKRHQASHSDTRDRSGVIGRSVCFGFPYTDTLKILQKWGSGCHFFGSGLDSELADLEALLQKQQERFRANPSSTNPDDKPILALYCEFPSNPLLRSPNLARLRELSLKYNFVIVVDETVGGFCNIECLPLADIVVSSLTKIFSGDSNVMGGSLTLNSGSPHYERLKSTLEATYDDTYYFEDALFMERNSRDFRSRVVKINASTETVCDMLNSYTVESGRSLVGNGRKPVVTKVYYPKFITPDNYRAQMRTTSILVPSSNTTELASSNGTTVTSHHATTTTKNDRLHEDQSKPGYGGLFSITFTTLEASRAFFDNLRCCKGPSLGTNFTLACPYTVLAHYLELDWAKEYEVEEGLVRVSVGLEGQETLREWFEDALRAAECA